MRLNDVLRLIGGLRGFATAIISSLVTAGIIGPEWKPIIDVLLP